MRLRLLTAAGLVLATVFGLPAGASASHDPSGEPSGEDFATGTAFYPTRSGDFVWTIDAHSGPSGENPRGTVVLDFVSFEQPPERLGEQPVVCLTVSGSRATVGIGTTDRFVFDIHLFSLDSNSQGVFGSEYAPSIPCPLDFEGTIFIGGRNVVVHDAPARPTSKDQCKNGGWRNFGSTFKNEGLCVAFVQRGPKA
jgi:hypothetical protein